jgi:hypothetical protein
MKNFVNGDQAEFSRFPEQFGLKNNLAAANKASCMNRNAAQSGAR